MPFFPRFVKPLDRSAIPEVTALQLLQAEEVWAVARLIRLIRREEDAGCAGARYGGATSGLPSLYTCLKNEQAARAAFETLRIRAAQPRGLDAVAAEFGLSDVQRAALLLSACCSVGREVPALLGRVQNSHDRTCSVAAVFAFLDLSLDGRVVARRDFRADGALRRNGLIELGMGRQFKESGDLLAATVLITAPALELIVGGTAFSDEMAEFSALEEPKSTFDRVVLPAEDRGRIFAVVDRSDRVASTWRAWGVDEVVGYGRGTLMLFAGPPGTGKTSTAHAVAHRLGLRVLNIDIPRFAGHQDAARFLPQLFRAANRQRAVLFFDECEALFASRESDNKLMAVLLTEIERFEGIAILATNMPDKLDAALDRRIRVRVTFARPDAVARREIWMLHTPPRAVLAEDVDFGTLASRFDMPGAYIKNAYLNAIAAAVNENPEAPVLRQAHLEAAARDQSQRRPAAGSGHVAVEPRAKLSDVCMPAAVATQIEDLVRAAGVRRTVFERWGVAARQSGGRGVIALFHGAPGTGKTLTAEAVAGELGRTMVRVALPQILSRWVGEAQRSLAGAFEYAASVDAVLVLDEVDGLLMSRGDGQASRHDDNLVNTLLDLLDRHEGVVVMCTNRPEILDGALDRRVGWSVSFPVPDDATRAAIWSTVVPPMATGGVALDMRVLASRYPLCGGRIRNAAVRAASRAASRGEALDLVRLMRAAAEECGDEASLGRSVLTFNRDADGGIDA